MIRVRLSALLLPAEAVDVGQWGQVDGCRIYAGGVKCAQTSVMCPGQSSSDHLSYD